MLALRSKGNFGNEHAQGIKQELLGFFGIVSRKNGCKRIGALPQGGEMLPQARAH